MGALWPKPHPDLDHGPGRPGLVDLKSVGADPREHGLMKALHSANAGAEDAAVAATRAKDALADIQKLRKSLIRHCEAHPVPPPPSLAANDVMSVEGEEDRPNPCSVLLHSAEKLEHLAGEATMHAGRALRFGRMAVNAAQQANLIPVFAGDPNFLPRIEPEEDFGGDAKKCHLECSHISPGVTWPPSMSDKVDFL